MCMELNILKRFFFFFNLTILSLIFLFYSRLSFNQFLKYLFVINFCFWENQFELNNKGSFRNSEKWSLVLFQLYIQIMLIYKLQSTC